jgi:hypothetical protein
MTMKATACVVLGVLVSLLFPTAARAAGDPPLAKGTVVDSQLISTTVMGCTVLL